ncbi:MAG: HDIG domain-containing metalloprotein [Acidobacteriota bacterium]
MKNNHSSQVNGTEKKRSARASNVYKGNRWLRRLRKLPGQFLHDQRAWTLLLVSGLLLMTSQQQCGVSYPDFQLGDITRFDIHAPFAVEVADEAATEDLRKAERERINPVYDFDPRIGLEIQRQLQASFQEVRNRFGQIPPGPDGRFRNLTEEQWTDLAEQFSPSLDRKSYKVLAKHEFSETLETDLLRVLAGLYRKRIVTSKALLGATTALRLRDTRSGEESVKDDLEGILDLEEAGVLLGESLQGIEILSPAEAGILVPFLEPMLHPTLSFNGEETERRREEAAGRITPLVTKIPKAKNIIRKGEEVTEQVLRQLRAIETQSGSRVELVSLLGSLLLILLMLFFMWRYATYHQRSYTRVRELYLLLIMVIFSVLLVSKVFIGVSDAFTQNMLVEPFTNATSYYYVIPVGAGAMMVTLLANARIAMVYSAFFSVLFGMLVNWEAPLMVFALVSNLGAIFGITQYQQRTALIRAGIAVGGINVVTIFAMDCITGNLEPISRVGLDTACGFAGGILLSGFVSFGLPLLENFFNVLTDVRLLELSNLNNPLLRKLAVQAPGSYNHSVMVGTLAEAGAEAIGANGLFCRVAAYYHDIGKMNHPEYYIENMKDGIYRHAGLSPSLSVLVIQNHVKEGIEMAKEVGIPQPIIDIIPQHHGTRLIRYFYEKAKKEEEEKGVQEVKAEDYRYPGPKPQSKEGAIFMLSDSIEAAARTVEEPSPARFKTVIRKIFNDIVLDRQFDECDLTFSDLDKIGEAFLKTLASIYHHRIDYPGFDFRSPDSGASGPEKPVEPRIAAVKRRGWK